MSDPSVPARLTIRQKLVVNGQEYASVDEMPPEIRDAFQRAVTRGAGRSAKISFGEQEYASMKDMPAEGRRLYEDVLKSLGAKPGAATRRLRVGRGLRSLRRPLTFLLLSAGLALLYVLRHRS